MQAAPRFYCHFVQQEMLPDRMAISECKESIEALSSRRSTRSHYSTRRTSNQLCPMIKQTRNNCAVFGLRSFGISGTALFICLCLLLGPGIAAGQTAQPTTLNPSELLERYDNPPAYIYRLETGPRLISQFGPFTSFQVNVDANCNNILGDAANESSIAVDPTNGNKNDHWLARV